MLAKFRNWLRGNPDLAFAILLACCVYAYFAFTNELEIQNARYGHKRSKQETKRMIEEHESLLSGRGASAIHWVTRPVSRREGRCCLQDSKTSKQNRRKR